MRQYRKSNEMLMVSEHDKKIFMRLIRKAKQKRAFHFQLKILKYKEKKVHKHYGSLTRLSLRSNGEIESFTDKQKGRVQYQISFTRNVKGTSLKQKRLQLET